MTSALKGVLFDFDGVLINSLTAMRLSFEAAYRDVYGHGDVDFDALFGEYRLHLGKGFLEIMHAMHLSEELHPHFKRHSRYLARYIYTYRGIDALLKGLSSEQWVLGIATGKDYARTCELLDQLGLRQYFSVVLGCDSVAAPKPAPDMVYAFISATGVSVDRMVMVGDATSDLQCAHNAHCKSVAALWGFSSEEALMQESPDFTAHSPEELLVLCQTLAKEFQ